MIITTLNIHKAFLQKYQKVLKDYKTSDIISLQETGIVSDETIADIEATSPYRLITSNGINNRNAGVALLYKKDMDLIDTFHIQGRTICARFKIEKKNLCIYNVYGASVFKLGFELYTQIYDHFRKIYNNNDIYIFNGDFNLYYDSLDNKNDLPTCQPLYILNLFSKIKNEFVLVDAYRHKNPRKRVFTFLRGEQGTRIDRIYVSQAVVNQVRRISHSTVSYSDHKSVQIQLQLGSDRWGRGKWKMNTSVLEEENYICQIQALWRFWQNEKSGFDNPISWWEEGKEKIKLLTINYSMNRTKNIKKEISILQERQTYIENNFNINLEYYKNEIDKLLGQIKTLKNKINKGILIRSKLPYEESDLDNIHIFKKAEIENGTGKQLERLIDDSGIVREGREEIIDIVEKFYSKLYSADPIPQSVIDEYLDNSSIIPLPSVEASAIDNQIISKEEIKRALHEFQNDKSPGIDGIPKEFYLKFWDVFQDDLSEVINNVFLQEELSETMKTSIISIHYKNKGSRNDLKNYRPIHPLALNISNNRYIRGIDIPNYHRQVKTFQHADDLSVIISDPRSFSNLDKELSKFEKASGSKINKNKTEIYTTGAMSAHVPDADKLYIKPQIKILGIYFGNNNHDINWNPILNRIRNTLHKWKNRSLKFKDKIKVLNTYILSQVWYVGRIVKPDKRILKELNRAIYSFIWDGKIEWIARNTLQLPLEEGGLGVCDISLKLQAFDLQQIKWFVGGSKHPWKSLLYFWMGPTLRELDTDRCYSVTTFQAPPKIYSIACNYRKTKNIINWGQEVNSKIIYFHLLKSLNYTLTIQRQYPPIKFSCAFQNLWKSSLSQGEKEFLYLLIHSALPTRQLLSKRSTREFDDRCRYCLKAPETLLHLFVVCNKLVPLRNSFCHFMSSSLRKPIQIHEFTRFMAEIDKSLFPHMYHYFKLIWTNRSAPKPVGDMIDTLLYRLLEISPLLL